MKKMKRRQRVSRAVINETTSISEILLIDRATAIMDFSDSDRDVKFYGWVISKLRKSVIGLVLCLSERGSTFARQTAKMSKSTLLRKKDE